MTRNFLFLIAVVGACLLSGFSVRAVTDWYRYDGVMQTQAAFLNPQNYTYLNSGAPASPGANNCLHAIKVDRFTEVYASGAYMGKPKVDVTGSSLQMDILNAMGMSDIIKNEIVDRVLLGPC